MNKIAPTILFLLLIPFISFTQNKSPFSAGTHKIRGRVISGNLDLTFGIAPKSTVQAFKGTISVNNLLYNRIGFYTSFEKGAVSNYSANTIGGTLTISNRIYVWGGIDIFTPKGIIYTKNFKGPRKEVGIGVVPVRKLVLRAGWSQSVGPTLTAGIRITFEQIKELNSPEHYR